MRGANRTILCGSIMALWLVLGLSGCDCAGDPQSTPCDSAEDCPSGQPCVDAFCRLSCNADEDCPSGQACREGVCRPGDDGGLDPGPQDSGPRPDAGPCRAVSGESMAAPLPVDIIVAIDNSGSMTEEAEQVRLNINNFASIIAESGLDYRVVLISSPDNSRRGVCVDPPLGSGPPMCESGEEGRLLALPVTVGSRNAPDLVLRHYDDYQGIPGYRDFLRENSAKVFLWITDDESGTYSADSFRQALEALEPEGMFEHTIHNAIVGFYGETPDTWSTRDAGECSTLARVGSTYLRLTNCLRNDNSPIEGCTPGRQARVCETDWTAIFEEIARGVVAGVPVQCEFAIPEAPTGYSIDFDEVTVTYRSGDTERSELDRVENRDACTSNGWYFDDPEAPTEIVLCPEVCRTVQADPEARMDVGLGCLADIF